MDPNQNQNPNQPLNQTPLTAPVQPGVPATPVAPLDGSHDYTHPIIDPPKHTYHPKRFMIALGLFVGVCILAVGTMLLVALLPPTDSKPTKTTNQSSKPSTETPVTAATAITHVKEYFKGAETAKSPIMRPVQAPNVNYYTVVPDIAPLVSVAGEVASDKAMAQVTAIVHSLDGDKYNKTIVSDGSGTSNYQAYFTRNDSICEADLIKPQDPKANQWIEAKCLDMSVYSEYAKDQSTFASIYTPLSATSVIYGFVGKATITNGSTSGYKRAQLQVSSILNNQLTTDGKYAIYYQTPDGLWHYFADQDNNVAVECEKYVTQDVISAYAGAPCRSLKTGQVGVVPQPKKTK